MIKIPARIETIRSFKKSGGRVAAVLPIHYSRELLRAFDILPVEVWGPPRVATGKSAAHLQAYVCSICHHALSYIKQGGLEIVDLLLVPHACDSLQGLGSLLLDFVPPRQPVFPLYIPRGCRMSDLDFFAAELRRLYDCLSEWTGRLPLQSELLASIQREETADSLLKQLHEQIQRLPFSNAEIYKLIRSREYLPAEDFIRVGREVLDLAQGKPRRGTAVLLEGIVPEPMGIFNMLSDLGAVVAGDDFACCGRRLYPAGTNRDPFLRMAERILHAPPDPTRGSSIEERRTHLLEMVDRTGAVGLIFYILKFCEPELFDLPSLQAELRNSTVPTLFMEIDLAGPVTQQVHTRLGAFLEMLQ